MSKSKLLSYDLDRVKLDSQKSKTQDFNIAFKQFLNNVTDEKTWRGFFKTINDLVTANLAEEQRASADDFIEIFSGYFNQYMDTLSNCDLIIARNEILCFYHGQIFAIDEKKQEFYYNYNEACLLSNTIVCLLKEYCRHRDIAVVPDRMFLSEKDLLLTQMNGVVERSDVLQQALLQIDNKNPKLRKLSLQLKNLTANFHKRLKLIDSLDKAANCYLTYKKDVEQWFINLSRYGTLSRLELRISKLSSDVKQQSSSRYSFMKYFSMRNTTIRQKYLILDGLCCEFHKSLNRSGVNFIKHLGESSVIYCDLDDFLLSTKQILKK